MEILKQMAQWDFTTWVVFLYMAIAVVFMIYLFIRILHMTDYLEKHAFLSYVAVLWSVFWPICLVKDLFCFFSDDEE